MNQTQMEGIKSQSIKRNFLLDYIYLGSIGVLIVSLFLPIYSSSLTSIGGLVSMNQFDYIEGQIFAGILAIIFGVFFLNKKISEIGGVLVNLGVLAYFIYYLLGRPETSFDFNIEPLFFFGGAGITEIIGIGVYLGILSLLASIITGSIALLKSR